MRQFLRHGAAGARERRGLDRVQIVADLQCDPGDRLDEGLERVVAGDEVRLGVHLHHRGTAWRGRHAHQALRGDTSRLLRRGGEALGAQPVDGCLRVATAFGQRLLAVHHARAGLLTQLLHQRGGNLWHGPAPQAFAVSAGTSNVRHRLRRQVSRQHPDH